MLVVCRREMLSYGGRRVLDQITLVTKGMTFWVRWKRLTCRQSINQAHIPPCVLNLMFATSQLIPSSHHLSSTSSREAILLHSTLPLTPTSPVMEQAFSTRRRPSPQLASWSFARWTSRGGLKLAKVMA